jgi:hypothetical protein
MTQKEVDIIFSLTIAVHEREWFGKRKNPVDRNKAQEWVAEQLALCLGIYTVPIGCSWGAITSKEHYEEYWAENSNFNERKHDS